METHFIEVTNNEQNWAAALYGVDNKSNRSSFYSLLNSLRRRGKIKNA